LLNSGEVYRGVSLAPNPLGEPVIAFISTSPQPDHLNLIERTCGILICTWPTPPAVTAYWSGAGGYYSPTLKLVPYGRLVLSYVETTGGVYTLRVGKRKGTSTAFETLYSDRQLGLRSSLALTSAGTGRISFNEGGDLLFGWEKTKVYIPMVTKK
jgi:hypothetical protein